MFTKKQLRNKEGKPSVYDMDANVDRLHIEYEVELIKMGVVHQMAGKYTYIRGYRDENDELLENIVEKLKTIFPDSTVLLVDEIENEEENLDSQVYKVMDSNCEYIPCRKYIIVSWIDEESINEIKELLASLYADLEKTRQDEEIYLREIRKAKSQLRIPVKTDSD